MADGTVFIGSTRPPRPQPDPDNGLYAVDAATGNGRWRFQADGPVESSPTVAGKTVFFTSRDRAYALSAETGARRWQTRYENNQYSMGPSPIVVDGIVYIGTENGLCAIESGVSGSSWGSRVQLQTLGHHGVDEVEKPALQVQTSSISYDADDGGAGFGGPLCVLGGAGYLSGRYLKSRTGQNQS